MRSVSYSRRAHHMDRTRKRLARRWNETSMWTGKSVARQCAVRGGMGGGRWGTMINCADVDACAYGNVYGHCMWASHAPTYPPTGDTRGDAQHDATRRRSKQTQETQKEIQTKVGKGRKGTREKRHTTILLIVPSSTTCVATIALPNNVQNSAATSPACIAVSTVRAVEPCSRREEEVRRLKGRVRK